MRPQDDAPRRRRAELVQTITQALIGIGENVDEEIGMVDKRWRGKLEQAQSSSMAAVDHTRDSEVAALKAKLQEAEEERDALATEKRAHWAEAHKELQRVRRSKEADTEAINGLRESLEKARERYDTVKDKLINVVKIAQTRKEQVVGWIKYADSLEAKIQRLEKRKGRQSGGHALFPHTDLVAVSGARGTTPSMPLTPVTAEKPRPVDRHTELEVEKPSISASFSSSSSSFLGMIASFDDDINAAAAGKTGTGTNEANDNEPELPARTSAAGIDGQSNEAALESTQGEPSSDGSPLEHSAPYELPTPRAATTSTTEHIYIKEEPSSDEPAVVWERPVKRSRTDDRNSTPSRAMVKRERDVPAVAQLSTIALYRGSQESVDLDEGQLTVPTPRKPQLFLERLPSERESISSSDDGMHSFLSMQSAAATLPAAPAPLAPSAPSTPLAPVSGNIHRSTKDPRASLKRRIESLAETNDGYNSPGSASRRTAMEPPVGLNSLPNLRTVGPGAVMSSSARYSPAKHQTGLAFDSPLAHAFQPPPPRRLPHQRGANTPSSASTGPGASARAGAALHTPSTSSRPREPLSTVRATPLTVALEAARAENATKTAAPCLREKAMELLKMDDFKINPAANNGDTFAYTEVVRGRTDRANLAGCTDPQCCGKVFRGMAVSELDAAGQAHIDRAEGVSLMARHLGDEAYRLAAMGPDKRRELWVEARTKELADKYGKHRHRYHRRMSPPGFWDTDFPTSQEEEYNRAEAEKVERLTVQERYREAMKPGGRWLFRDE